MRLLRALVGLAVFAFPISAATQPYPVKPLRIVVPWPPAGVSDVMTRAVANAMGESMGQQVVVENRPGAGGTLGVAAVAKSAPDGYTLVATDVPSHAISATLYSRLPYDVLGDFESIAIIAGSPMVLTTHPSLNVRTVNEFIQLVRQRPGQLAYGSSGNGAITHLAIERLKKQTGILLNHVLVLPDVAAIAESLPGFDMGFYTALYAPARTPREIVDKLSSEMAKAQGHPKTREIFAASAAEAGTMTPAQLRDYMASEVKSWGEIVRAVGLKID